MLARAYYLYTESLYLILIQILVYELVLSLLLESDDDQGDEDVDEKEREDNEVDDVEDRHVHSVIWLGTLVLECGVHGMA